jgi:two-component system, cell cycle response regulator
VAASYNLTVRLFGFSAPEKQMLNSIFRLSATPSRRIGYRPWDAATSTPPDMILLDGDSDTAVAAWKAECANLRDRTVVAGVRNADIGCQSAPKPLGLKIVGALDRAAIALLPAGAAAEASLPAASLPKSAPTPTPAPAPAAKPAPVIKNEPAARAEALATTNSTSGAADQAFRVLAVDDSPLMRTFLQTKLQPYGIAPDFAVTGEEALFKLSSQRFDLIFLDVMLPGMDGYDVCKAIKKNKESAKTKVIMLTSRDKTFDKIRGTMAGCDGYLTKPVDEMKLRGILERFPTGGK